MIEVIVACVLAAVMLTALAGIFRALLMDSRGTSWNAISQVAAARLRSDLCNARTYRFESGILQLAGPIALDPREHQPLWQEARVEYRVRSSSQGGILIRQQEIGSGPVAIRSEHPLWLGIRALEFESGYLNTASLSQTDEQLFGTALPGGWRKLPNSFQLRLRDPSNRVCFSESMVGVLHD